jgi:hypothetical protein
MKYTTLKTALALVAAFTMTINAPAQLKHSEVKQEKIRQERILESFKTSLKSDYLGVVEGTIYNIVVYKKFYPQLDYADLVAALNHSSLKSDNVAVRYKAHLASLYLTNTAAIEVDPLAHPSDHEYIFKQIAQQLETKFLVAR